MCSNVEEDMADSKLGVVVLGAAIVDVVVREV